MAAEKGQRGARLIATVAGLGEVLPAPGTTAGSFPAALLWCALAVWAESTVLMVCTAAGVVLATTAGLWASGVESRRRGAQDPGPVVIDEVAGQWLTYLVALVVLPGREPKLMILLATAGFFAFRFFDITKVWPANRLEALHGGLGIMADDLAAGLWAGLVVAGSFLALT